MTLLGIRIDMNNKFVLRGGSKVEEAILRYAQNILRTTNVREQGKMNAFEELDGVMMAAMVYSLSSPFWSRVWIVQEVISAKSLVLQIADHSIRLESFSAFLTAIRSLVDSTTDDSDTNEFSILTPHSHVRTRRVLQNIRAAESIIRKKLYTAPHPVPLYELLMSWSTQECTEPRDIIFGLLGMSKSRVVVNYDVSMTQLFLNVLIEGLFDIVEATREEDTKFRQHMLQWEFCGACMAAFSYSRTNATVLCIVRNAMQCCGILHEGAFRMLWEGSYASKGIAMENWPRPVHVLMSQYAVVTELLTRLGFGRASLRYHEIHARFLYAIQEYKLQAVRSSNRTMVMPDGEACSYSEWIARINETADFVEGLGPCPQDLDNSNRDERIRDYRRQMQFQKTLEVVIELLFAMVVVSVGVLLGALLETTFALLTSLMIWIAAPHCQSHTTSNDIALHNEEL